MSTALTTTTATSKDSLDQFQTIKAVKALQAHLSSKKKESFKKPNLLAENSDDDSDNGDGSGAVDPDMAMWLQVTTKKYITDQKKLKPSKINLPNPLIRLSPTISICLIVKDPSTTYKSLLPGLNLPATATFKITTPTKLRTKYKSYESRRQLERAHDIFLADDRVICMLPAILGKSVYARSAKIPVPVNIANKSNSAEGFKKEIEKALGATYFRPSPSDCHAVKVGTRTMPAEQIAENVEAVVHKLVEKHVPKGWEGLRGLHIKAAETVALPIWLTDNLYDAEEDVLTTKEVAAIEYAKTPEGRAEAMTKKKEEKKTRRKEYAEKQREIRHWDSDAESDEEQQFVTRPKKIELPIMAPVPVPSVAGTKRKAVDTTTAATTTTAEAAKVVEPVPVITTKKQKTVTTEETPTETIVTITENITTTIPAAKTKKESKKVNKTGTLAQAVKDTLESKTKRPAAESKAGKTKKPKTKTKS